MWLHKRYVTWLDLPSASKCANRSPRSYHIANVNLIRPAELSVEKLLHRQDVHSDSGAAQAVKLFQGLQPALQRKLNSGHELAM